MIVEAVTPEQAPILARPYYGEGETSPLVTSLAHVPEALDVTMPFVGVVLGPSAIGARLKELVILRASVLQECRYCVQTHSVVALDSDLSLDQVRALRGEGTAEAFADLGELALIGWVDAVAGGVGPVAPEIGAQLREHFSAPEVVELTLLAAATVMLNRYCTALELPTGAATLERLAAEALA